MKKLITLSFVTALLTLFVTGCGSERNKNDAKGKTKTIGVTIYSYADAFVATIRKQLVIDAKNSKGSIKLAMSDAQNDQSKENDLIDVLLSKQVNVLAINLVDPAAASTVIAKVKKQNVPIVFFNKEPSKKDLNSYDKAYFVGTESKQSGVIQAEVIAKAWKANPKWDLNGDGVIQFVYLKGEPGHPDAEARYKYSIKKLNEMGIKTQEIYMTTGMWLASVAKDKVDAWLSGPNRDKIEMVISGNDTMALGAIQALKNNGKPNIPVFGVDGIPEVLSLIGKGQMAGTVLQSGADQANAVFDMAKNLANGKNPVAGSKFVIKDKAVRIPYIGVDKDNYKQFQKKVPAVK